MRAKQMRRQARRMRRHGLQPMVFIDSDGTAPEIAGVIIGRWLWRYRSELAPVAVAIVLLLGASALHHLRPEWWSGLLVASASATLALLRLGGRLGLTVRSEKAYAATVTFNGGSWLAAATALGVTYKPLPQFLVVGGLIAAVPWWTHRRRRARVRVDRKLAAWPEIAPVVGLTGSRVMSAVVDIWGWRARFALARGQTIEDVTAKIPAIESALGTHRGAVRVYPTRDDKANRFELRVLDTDPHADAIPWPGPSVTSVADPIDLGPFEDASTARVLLLRRHALLGGIAGSGKSGGINVLMGNLTACRDVVIWAIDLKRGMELQPWASCIDRLATNPEQARSLLQDAVSILEGRAAWLAAKGRRVWDPTPELPALVIVVDEYAELAEEAPDAVTHADSIARRGRAVAVTLVAATQRPTQKAMGQGAVRSQMDVRLSFRVRERRDIDLILGQGMLNSGWHAHTLNSPGKFLISAPEHDAPRRARAYLLTDDRVAEAAQTHSASRPRLDEISRRAVEDSQAGLPHPEEDLLSPSAMSPFENEDTAEATLQTLLKSAPEEGIPVTHLVQATARSRRWVYYRLQDFSRSGEAVQVSRGRWRATTKSDAM